MQYSLEHMGLPPVQARLDIVMPQTAQSALEIFAGLIVLYTAYYFFRQAKIEKSNFPLLFWLGTVPLMLAEPLIDINMTCFYPQVGQHVAFELYGRQMPVFLVLCYLGGIAPVMYGVGMQMAAGVGRGYVWKALAIVAVGTALYEIIPVNVGLWTYYSPAHPIRFFKYPIGIAIENGVAFLLTALAVMKLRPLLQGAKQWLAPLILPIVFLMGEFGVGWPYFEAINTPAAIDNQLIGAAGFLGTLGLSLAVAWWITTQLSIAHAPADVREGLRSSNIAAQV